MTFQELFEQLKAQQKTVAEPKVEEKKNFNIEDVKKFLENFRNRSDEHGDQNN